MEHSAVTASRESAGEQGFREREETTQRYSDGWSTFTVCVCLYVILLGVSGVAELSRPDPKMNDDGEGDDVWVELLPVQLVDTH